MMLKFSATFISAACLLLSISTANGNDEAHVPRYLRDRQLQFDDELPQTRSSQCWLPWVNCAAPNQCENVSPLGPNQFNLNRYIEKSCTSRPIQEISKQY